MIMLFQEIHLDSRIDIDNHIYGTTNTTSSYDSNTAILNHEKKKNYYKTKNISYYYVNHVFGVLPLST
jgi:hypothetical protein